MPIHIAILLKPYIRLILDGRKTIESRLTKTPLSPFRAIEPGERIFIKASGGPFMATAVAGEIEFHDNLTPTLVKSLRQRLNDAICGDSAFWQWKRDARYATFIRLLDVEPIEWGPPFEPSRGPAWFVLPDDHAAPAVFDIELTDGAIRNRYVRVPRKTHKFTVETYGGTTVGAAGRPIELTLPDGQCVSTDLVSNHMIRWRGWGDLFAQYEVAPGDRVRFVQTGERRYRVRVVKEKIDGTRKR